MNVSSARKWGHKHSRSERNERKKTKPKVKLLKMNVTKVLTNNYEDQQKPAKKQSQFIGQNPYF